MESNKKNVNDLVWISWEKQRRSITLSGILNADYLELNYVGVPALLRYTKSTSKSLFKIILNRDSIIIVQNPSMILAFLATVFGALFNIKIIVDRHTDKYILRKGGGPLYKVMLAISDFTIKHARMTIVTNEVLSKTVNELGGNAYILPDPFPDIKKFVKANSEDNNKRNVSCLVVSSWHEDEPVEQLFTAAREIPEVDMYFSGKPNKSYFNLILNKPDNVHITGYLSDWDFYTLMNESDFVVAITTDNGTLVCGGYEAITLSKPFLTGNNDSLRDYFGDAAVYTDSTVENIVSCIKYIVANTGVLQSNAVQLYENRSELWNERLSDFMCELNRL